MRKKDMETLNPLISVNFECNYIIISTNSPNLKFKEISSQMLRQMIKSVYICLYKCWVAYK